MSSSNAVEFAPLVNELAEALTEAADLVEKHIPRDAFASDAMGDWSLRDDVLARWRALAARAPTGSAPSTSGVSDNG